MNFYGWHRLDDINKYFENLKLPVKIKKEIVGQAEIYSLNFITTYRYIKFSPILSMCGALLIHEISQLKTTPIFFKALDKLVTLTSYSQLLCYWSIEENGNPSSLLENGFKIIDSFTNYRTGNLVYVLSKKYNYDNDTYSDDFEDHFDNIFKQSLVKENNV